LELWGAGRNYPQANHPVVPPLVDPPMGIFAEKKSK